MHERPKSDDEADESTSKRASTAATTRRRVLRGIGVLSTPIWAGSAAANPPNERGYYTGTTVHSSNYRSLQAAVSDASARDTVVVDTDHTLSSHINLRSDIKIEGDGGTITLANGANDDVLRTEDCENVWIDGVHIDGNKANQSGDGRGIGGSSIGTISNIRVTNCHIENCWGNAISFTSDDAGTSITDIYLGHNELRRSGRHGIVLGVSGGDATMRDVMYDSNTVVDVDRAQHMGFFGHAGSTAKNAALIGNEVSKSTGREKGTGTALEEITRNCVVYGNSYDDMTGKTGPVVTKDGRNNLVAGNRVRNTEHGVGILNFNYYEPDGPPTNNVVTHNDIANCNNGVRLNNLEGGNVVYHNRIRNCENGIGGNSDDGVTVFSNSSGTSRKSVGLPDEIGTGVTYRTPDGRVGAEASWSRGSPHPDDPVRVTVQTYPERY